MNIKKILRRHWLATIILICSLGVIGWYGFKDYHPAESAPTLTNSERIETTVEIKNQEQTKNFPDKNSPNPAMPEAEQKQKYKSEATVSTTSTSPASTEIPVDKGTEITFVINGESYKLNVLPGTSVYDALRILDTNKISVKFKNFSGLGYFVDGINGKNSDTIRGTYWIYYINGAKAQVGISQYTIKENDVITWKYENQE